MTKLFGREPAAILAFIASGLMIVSQFVYPLTIDQQGGFNAVAMSAVGILTMWMVAEDGGLGLIVGLSKALIALAISFGLNWAPDVQNLVMTFVTVTAQLLIIRPNVVAPIKADGTAAKGKELT